MCILYNLDTEFWLIHPKIKIKKIYYHTHKKLQFTLDNEIHILQISLHFKNEN